MSESVLPAPRAVIFDWDNTLVNTWPVIHEALQRTFEELGKETWPIEVTMQKVRKSMRDSFPEIFGANWEEAGKRYQSHYRARNLAQLEALPKAKELLEELQALGVPALVVSNKKGVNLRQEVAHLGWQKHFAGVIGADDAARDKPHADPVLLALSALEMEAGPDIWFVGDSDIDLACAAACGCTPVLYGPHAASHAEYTPSHYQGFPYAVHVHTHDELTNRLRRVVPRSKPGDKLSSGN
ncbi:MAG: HAD family hydrolase [Alphaproteobacteria bacterium]|nr:HAD family hydrolase [Alphaproteobacteria bacterium]